MRRALAAVLASSALAATLALACSGSLLSTYCTGIPDGGCPAGIGVDNCVDSTCEALYSSDPQCTWTFVMKCPDYRPPVDAGHPVDGDAAPLADGQAEAATRPDATFVLPAGANGGPGCADLEDPDCPLGEAVGGLDCNGCEGLWVCDDGGWDYWGACDEAGAPEPGSS